MLRKQETKYVFGPTAVRRHERGNDTCFAWSRQVAKYNLSYSMLTGRGTARDKEQGLDLLKQAASDGMPKAQFNLAMHTLRTPRSKDEAKEAMEVRCQAPSFPVAFWGSRSRECV